MAVAAVGSFAVCNPLNEACDASPQAGVLESRESFRERKAVRCSEELRHIIRRRRLVALLFGLIWSTFEEKLRRDPQRFSDLMQCARANSIRPTFIFLDLLKRHSKGGPKIGLGQPKRRPLDPHTAPHMLVDGIGDLRGGQ